MSEGEQKVYGGEVRIEAEQRASLHSLTIDAIALAKKNPKKFLLAGLMTLIGFQLLP